MTTTSTPGIHHVSAIAGDPRANVAFYTDTLGLRLVKRTVNFDDRFAHHLYYGDETGSAGTLLTFFPYPHGTDGRVGKPQPSATAFVIPADAAEYWHDRLADRGVDVDHPAERFGDPVVAFRDGDGLELELVATASARPPATASVPAACAIRGLHGVTLYSTSVFHTAATLEVLGFELVDQEGDRVRYRVSGAGSDRTETGDGATPGARSLGTVVDLIDAEVPYGREGSGTVHHVAFRAGDRSLPGWRDRLLDAGLEPTWIRDRRYFESVYVREPGGILFEIATDGPGFTVDEEPPQLGTALQLPPQFEPDREAIERQLPSLDGPSP